MFNRENPRLTAFKACVDAVDSLLIDYRGVTQELARAVDAAPEQGLDALTIESLAYRIHVAAEQLDSLGTTLGRFATSYSGSLPVSG